MISVADCKRQGVGLYWTWRHCRSEQQDSTNDVTRIPGRRPRDVTTIGGDVTQRYRELRSDVKSKNDTDRWIRDGNAPAGRRIRQLDPLIQDPNDHRQEQQLQKLPRQRRRHRPHLTSRTSMEVSETKSRGFYTSRGIPVTSRVALGDVTTFLTTPRDLSRLHNFPMTSSFATSTPVIQRSMDSKWHAGGDTPGVSRWWRYTWITPDCDAGRDTPGLHLDYDAAGDTPGLSRWWRYTWIAGESWTNVVHPAATRRRTSQCFSRTGKSTCATVISRRGKSCRLDYANSVFHS